MRKRLLPVKLSVGEEPLGNRPLQAVVVMSVEELKFFCQVPINISLESLDGATVSTIEWADNREQFDVGLRFPISSLVKQFLHFTWEPPALLHPNVFRILMGCSMLNSLYQLDISSVEICFIYTSKLGIGLSINVGP